MELQDLSILQTNMTIVYAALDLESISRDALRRLLPDQPRPIITDLPDILAIIYPQVELACMIGDRRIRANDGSRESVGKRPLVRLALAASETAKDADIAAYGFNFDITGCLADIENAEEYLKAKLLANVDELQAALGGSLGALVPRLRYVRDSVSYDLVIEPSPQGTNEIKAHINAHFAQMQLPDEGALDESLRQEYEYFISTLGDIL